MVYTRRQMVSRCRTREESEESITCRRRSMQVRDRSQARSHEKSKTGVSVASQIGHVLQNLKKNLWFISSGKPEI